MEFYAVITGDIINSSDLGAERRQKLLDSLKEAFQKITENVLNEKENPFEIYRGDSFQAKIKNSQLAIFIGIIIRAKIRSLNYEIYRAGRVSVGNLNDARIAVGIGKIDFAASKTIESDGEAFKFSGELIEKMKREKRALMVRTPWLEVNSELEVECLLVDQIISDWSFSQAEVVYEILLGDKIQSSLAKKIGISQPAVSKRITSAKIEGINLFINRYKELIGSKI